MVKFNLSYIVNSLLKDRHCYKTIPIKYKEDNFFIINRFLSKKFPEQAQKFNKKNIDKSLALDLWFLYLRHKKPKTIYKWIWNKVPPKKRDISEVDFKHLLEKMEIRREDLEFLIRYHKDYINEELKYYKALKKETK